ncbi:MAG: MarR family transcriptional regulator [Casimicrobiaceae bacterium]
MNPLSEGAEDFNFWLHRLSHDWHKALDRRLRPLGLSRATWMLLALVRRLGAPNQTELAEGLGVAGPSIVRLVDFLEREQLVERHAATDRRVRTVRLTPKGEQLSEQMWRVAAHLRKEVMHDIPLDDIEQARRLMARLHLRLKNLA